jgi:hypothetical protein
MPPVSEPCASLVYAIRGARARVLAASFGAVMLALAACNGTAVVTLTSSASQDNFLAYRVGLVSVELESTGGKSGLKILPASTTMDLAALTNVSEVLGAAAVTKGSYTSAIVTLDYSSAQIVYDDGSLNGVALTPVGANGKAVGQVELTVNLDPGNSFSVSANQISQLAMNFNLAASNIVNLSAKTVTVAPMIAASALPIDAKQVRIRGPLLSAAAATADAATTSTTAATSFTMGVTPFNGIAGGAGSLAIITSDATTYEVNGSAATGSDGGTQLGGLSAGTLTVAYGVLVTADATTTTTVNGVASTSTSSNVSFTASQVLAGSSVQGGGLDRVSGVVAGRSGNTLVLADATLIGNDGVEAFVGGATTVDLDPATLVTVFGQGEGEFNTLQQISVGSAIDAFGVATSPVSGSVTLDASAGRVRLDNTTASGLVTAQGWHAELESAVARRPRDRSLRFRRQRRRSRPIHREHGDTGPDQFHGGCAGDCDRADRLVRSRTAGFHRLDPARPDNDSSATDGRLEQRDGRALRYLR